MNVTIVTAAILVLQDEMPWWLWRLWDL